jgi:putative nucleotidyltransferase with HDIG domain
MEEQFTKAELVQVLAKAIHFDRTVVRQWFTHAYLAVIIATGGTALLWCFANWHTDDRPRFLSFLATALVASVLKIRLPGIDANISVSVLFILVSIVNLSLPEALLIAVSSALLQCLWRGRPKLIHIGFSVCSMASAVFLSSWAYHYTAARIPELISLGVLTLTYFVANMFPIASIIALTGSKRLGEVWRGYRFMPPYYFVGASLAWVIGTVPRAIQWELPFICLPLVYLVHRSNHTYVAQIEKEKNHAEQMNAVHLRTIEALALAIDAKDHTTHDHLQRVQHYALEIGKDLRLSEQEMEALKAAAVLHDIGKLAVPEHIISKPGKLTRSEFEKMKVHPVVGAEILERVEFPYPVVPIVRAHHEKWDGKGYPHGLKGEAIPIGARILAVVDCLDALASDRQYRRALPLDEAMAKVAAEAGTSFDPAVVQALNLRYRELEEQVRSMAPRNDPVLSTDIKILNGAAPAAGYENEEAPNAEQIARLQEALQSESETARPPRAFDPPCFDSGTLRMQEVLAVVAMRLKDVLQFDAVAFYFPDERDVLQAQFVAGDDHRRLRSLRVPIGEGLIGWVAEGSKPIINGNPTVEPGFMDDKTSEPLVNLAVALPFAFGDDRHGVLALYRSSRLTFTSEDLAALVPVCESLGRIIAAAKPDGSTPAQQRTSVEPKPAQPAVAHVRGRVDVPA